MKIGPDTFEAEEKVDHVGSPVTEGVGIPGDLSSELHTDSGVEGLNPEARVGE